MKLNNPQPLGRFMIVRRNPPKDKLISSSLIILPQTQDFYNKECEVVSMSEWCKKFYPELSPGDKVAVLEFDGEQIDPIEDPWLLRITFDMVLGKVE